MNNLPLILGDGHLGHIANQSHFQGHKAQESLVRYLSLSQLVDIIIQRWLTILTGIAISVGLASIYCITAQRLYRSSATLEVRGYAPVFSDSSSEEFRVQDTRNIIYTNTIIRKLRSLSIANDVLSYKNIGERFTNNVNTDNEASDAKGGNSSNYKYDENVLNRYLRAVRIEPYRETSWIKIIATTPDPDLSATIANTHAQRFIEMVAQEERQGVAQGIELLKKESQNLDHVISGLQDKLNRYARENNLVVSTDENDSNLKLQEIIRLTQLLAEHSASRIVDESRLRTADECVKQNCKKGTSLDSPNLRELRLKLRLTEIERAELERRFTPKYPGLMRVIDRENSLRKALVSEQASFLEELRNKFEASQAAEVQIVQKIDTLKKSANQVSQTLIEYNLLDQQIQSLRQLYDDTIKEIKQREVTVASMAPNIFLVEQALPPTRPSSPMILITLILSAFLGGLISTVVAIAKTILGKRIDSNNEAVDITNLPLLTILPEVKDTAMIMPVVSLANRANGIRTVATNTKYGLRAPIRKAYRESIRRISTALIADINKSDVASRDKPEERSVSVLITSASSGDGKTSLASHLAIALSLEGYKTLLIDTDFAHGRIHTLFDIPLTEHGSHEFLNDDVSLDLCCHNTRYSNLDVIPLSEHTGAESFGTESFGLRLATINRKIKLLSQTYSFVIFDSSPILATVDPLILAGAVDSTVMVVRRGHTCKRALNEGTNRLKAVGSRLLGLVISGGEDDFHDHPYQYHSLSESSNSSEKFNRSANG